MYSFVILYPSHWLDKYDKKRYLDRDIRLSVVFPFSTGSELLTSDFIYIPFCTYPITWLIITKWSQQYWSIVAHELELTVVNN